MEPRVNLAQSVQSMLVGVVVCDLRADEAEQEDVVV
jgi:hypothetical protein